VNYQQLNKNLNVIVESNGTIHLTRRNKLNKNLKKKTITKRLQKTWVKGVQQRPTSTKAKKPKKEQKIRKDENISDPNTDGKSLVKTAFVKRLADTKLAKKGQKPKHIEQDFAPKPAPRAEKRKRLLASAKQAVRGHDDDDVPTLVDDNEERKKKSGGRSKKKVRVHV